MLSREVICKIAIALVFYSSCSHQKIYQFGTGQALSIDHSDAGHLFDKRNLKLVDHEEAVSIEKFESFVKQEIENENLHFAEEFDPYSKKRETPDYCILGNLDPLYYFEDQSQKIIWRKLYVSQYFYLGCKSQRHDLLQSVYLYCKTSKEWFHYYYRLNGIETWLANPILKCGNK